MFTVTNHPGVKGSMARLNTLIVMVLCAAGIPTIALAFGAIALGFVHGGGAINRVILTGGVTLLLAFLVRRFGIETLVPIPLPSSRNEVKKVIISVRYAIRDRLSDMVIASALFFAAVCVTALYATAFASSGVRGPLIEADAESVLVISGQGFWWVPVVQGIAILSQMFSPILPFVFPYGILYGVTIALMYGLFRLGMGRIVATLLTLSLMISSIQLDHFIPFWDKYYLRAPIVLALVLIMGRLVNQPFTPGKTIGLATLSGAVMGLGIMFRPDLLIFSMNILVTLFVFLPGSLRSNLRVKLTALILFGLATFFAFSTCPLCGVWKDSNSHAVIGGSTPFYDARLGLEDPGYDWAYLHLDPYTSSMSFAQAKVSDDVLYSKYGPVDDQLKGIVKNFPADTLVRFYATALRVIEIPFTYVLPPVGIANPQSFPVINAIYDARAALLNSLAGSGIWLCAASLLMIGAHSVRKTIFCLLLLPSLVILPFVHFIGYYFFYLEFITYWAVGFVLQHVWSFTIGLVRRDALREVSQWVAYPRNWWGPMTQRVAGLACGVALLLWGSLFVLRQYQSVHVAEILHRYETAPVKRLPIEALPLENERVLLTSPGQFKPPTERSFQVMELMAEFDGGKCGDRTVWATLRYAGASSILMDFSRSMSIDLGPSGQNSTRLFFPIMAQKDILGPGDASYFEGIELSSEQVACVRGLYSIEDPEKLPMLLTVTLPLAGKALYRRLTDWEGSRLHTVPAQLPAARVAELLARPLSPITSDEVDYRDPIFHLGISQTGKPLTAWRVHGYAKDNSDVNPLFPIHGPRWQFARSSYVDAHALLVDTDLLITKARWHRKGSAFVARGVLYSGGVMLGLMNEGRASGLVTITSPGAFEVVIEAPQDGMYAVGLANYVAYYNTMENRLVAQAGWVER